MGRIIGYSRVSTQEQGRSGLGLDAQESRIAGEASARGWEVEYVRDVGVSGSVAPDAREGLGPVLASMKRGDLLVCAKLDRLGRSVLDVLTIADRADREGWGLVLLDLGLDTSTPVGSFTLTVLAGVAQLERDMIRSRTSDALQELKRQGVRLGRPVELADETRQRIADLRAEGLSMRAIASTLTAEGVPTARGGKWAAGTVAHVLKSWELDKQAA